jgi:hypothetical protein
MFVDGAQPATLNDGAGKLIDYPTLKEAVSGWCALSRVQRARATVKVIGGPVYDAQQIPHLYCRRRGVERALMPRHRDLATEKLSASASHFLARGAENPKGFRTVDPFFAMIVDSLAPKLARLVSAPPFRYGGLSPDMPKSGVYLFTESGNHLYVGRSNNLRDRYTYYCRPIVTQGDAAFAFQLARGATGRATASHRLSRHHRGQLMLDPTFVAALSAAKERIKAMECRFVEEADQKRQALLEIYCTIVLQAPYNGFVSR